MSNVAATISVVPHYDNVDPASLSDKDLAIITQNGLEQVAHDSAATWTYETRRVAQPILDFLYLGPSSVARNRSWLQAEGITMILAARDTRQAGLNFMAVDKIAQELGIEARYVDVSGYHELIRAFPSAIRMINDHMLQVHRSGPGDAIKRETPDEGVAARQPGSKRGKILVFCETGNGRSASIVTAYVMAVLGISMEQACQFVNFKRFCVSMDDDLKHILKAYEDVLVAQRTVHQYQRSSDANTTAKKEKRGIDETVADDDNDDRMTGTDQYPGLDQDRFVGRDIFVPFVDR
ncbi:phosphatases II [Xylaria intraflava]|nr:phosphatases II [Xylaria intraflava]